MSLLDSYHRQLIDELVILGGSPCMQQSAPTHVYCFKLSLTQAATSVPSIGSHVVNTDTELLHAYAVRTTSATHVQRCRVQLKVGSPSSLSLSENSSASSESSWALFLFFLAPLDFTEAKLQTPFAGETCYMKPHNLPGHHTPLNRQPSAAKTCIPSRL